jgi:hypothetical protein
VRLCLHCNTYEIYFQKQSDGWWLVDPWVQNQQDQNDRWEWFNQNFGKQGEQWDAWGGHFVVRSEKEITWIKLAWAK